MRTPYLVEELLSPATAFGARTTALPGAGVLRAQAFRKSGRPHDHVAAIPKQRAWIAQQPDSVAYGWRREEACGYWRS